MQSRLGTLTLGLFFLFASLSACNKSQPSTTSTDNSANTSSPPAAAPAASQPPAMKPEAPKPVVVPAGTVLTVRLGQDLGSKISQAGQTFSATVATPVQIDGSDVIPAGASASGTVVAAEPLGRFKGGASLQIKLVSINIKGSDRPVETSSVMRTEKGKGKRTAVVAGGGAALGALIGGLAGGGKGAGIGALAGGGAGTAGAAFTGNKDIVLPAESAVSFKLEQPLEIK
ncbi:MAG TPA: hypothetical protein VLW84_03895 [Terriglobales bacterium]|nr:hypothetical protein [Terriglobales bacterium]